MFSYSDLHEATCAIFVGSEKQTPWICRLEILGRKKAADLSPHFFNLGFALEMHVPVASDDPEVPAVR